MEPTISGVGVIDKSMLIVAAVDAADRAGVRLSEIVDETGLPKPTAHRLAAALEAHGLLRRRGDGRFVLGTSLIGLGQRATRSWPITEIAAPTLSKLRRETGESAQLYVRDGDERVCLISLESEHELRTIVAEGSRLPLSAGSAGRILRDASAPDAWVESVEERASGVASVSAPVMRDGAVIAAIGISGPIERLGRNPGGIHGEAVLEAARSVGGMADRSPA